MDPEPDVVVHVVFTDGNAERIRQSPALRNLARFSQVCSAIGWLCIGLVAVVFGLAILGFGVLGL